MYKLENKSKFFARSFREQAICKNFLAWKGASDLQELFGMKVERRKQQPELFGMKVERSKQQPELFGMY